MVFRLYSLFVSILLLISTPIYSLEVIEILGGKASQIPIAVMPFKSFGAQKDIGKINSVIKGDLGRSGLFYPLDTRGVASSPNSDKEVNFSQWKSLEAQFLIIGRIDFIKKHNHIMCQKFLPKINKGDKRVFLINGKVCGAISRVPKKGSFLSNMSKGAQPINVKLTKKENIISMLIAKDLKKENIYFAGIDFIDQKLNGDINVTSPTGLKTLFDLSGINLAKTFWKNLDR